MKAMYPWDLIIKKFGSLLFVDKRDDENMIDWHTVSETAPIDCQPLDEEGVNGVRQLIKEASRLHSYFQSAM